MRAVAVQTETCTYSIAAGHITDDMINEAEAVLHEDKTLQKISVQAAGTCAITSQSAASNNSELV